jgi:nicotinamidase-related amidase
MSRYALVVVDMIKDNVNTASHGMLDGESRKIIQPILKLTRAFRRTGNHVVFACDSFMEGDFLFSGGFPPHAIRGTGGDRPIPDLEMQSADLYLQKRRMSSFHKTDLDQTLRTWGVTTVVVCGIVTNVCVLLTALDAVQNDFYSVLVSDASACHKPDLHEMTLKLYKSFQRLGLFRIMAADEIASELESEPTSR